MTNDDLLLLQTSVFTGITTDEIRDMLSCLSARETTFIIETPFKCMFVE